MVTDKDGHNEGRSQGHAEYRQVVLGMDRTIPWGGRLLSHESAIGCMDRIRVCRSKDFLTFFFLSLSEESGLL